VRLASEKAYYLIKEKITTLELTPSAVIDEQALMKDLGLGRTPIREALQRLAVEGLVNIVPRRGMFVADISITDLQKIFELRIILEGFCAELAAQRATEDQIAEIDGVFQDMARVASEDIEGLMAIDERFHRLMHQAADNEFLARTLSRLYVLSLRLWHLALHRLGDVREAIEGHREVAEAVKKRDGAQARAVMMQEIAQFQEEIKSAL
jgi:DNA-binding GntR family transcriptional regulator